MIQRSLSSTLSNMARRNMYLGRNDEAQRLLEECLEIRRELVDKHPALHDARLHLAANFDGLGDVAGRALPLTSQAYGRAMGYYQNSLEILEPLSRDNPVVAVYRNTLADVLRSMASVQMSASDFVSVSDTQRRLLKVLETSLAQDASNWHYHRDIALACDLQAEADRKLERCNASIMHRLRARSAWNEAQKLEATVLQRYRTSITDNLGNLMRELSIAERLTEVYEIALERRELCEGRPRPMFILAAGLERAVRAGIRGADLDVDQLQQAQRCRDLAIELFLAGAQAAPGEASEFVRTRGFMAYYAALATVEAALQKDPDSAALLARRSLLLRGLGQEGRATADRNRALEIVNSALLQAPSDVVLLKQRARLHFEADQWQEAALASAKVLASSPNDTQALGYLAQSSVRLGAFSEATKAYGQLWQRRNRRPVYVLEWCRAAHELGLAKQVVANEKRLWDLVGQDPVKAEATAWQMMADGDVARFPDMARQLAQKAVELKPQSTYRTTLGGVYVRLGRYQEALEALQSGAREPPGTASALGGFWLAITYHHLGEQEQSRAAYERALRSWKEATNISRGKHAFIESVAKEAKLLMTGSEIPTSRS
jgi:tetratricopeptide (TPR) repeat protein